MFVVPGIKDFFNFVFDVVVNFDGQWWFLGAVREWVWGMGLKERNVEYIVNGLEFEWQADSPSVSGDDFEDGKGTDVFVVEFLHGLTRLDGCGCCKCRAIRGRRD